jgi:hypothetical protein
MAKADPPQLLRRQDLFDACANDRKHPPEPSVKEQGLVAQNKEVVEGEPRGRRDVRHIGRNAINAVRNLVDPGFHLSLPLISSSAEFHAGVMRPLLHFRWARFQARDKPDAAAR